MAGLNSNIQITDLDFNNIKNNLKTFLKSQDTLKDYNYEGAALSTLLDVLAYNTQYNAFYLNMVANEMFLDSAVQRGSVVSHAKLLNYTPKSETAATAKINLKINGVVDTALTLPAYTTFLSEAIDGINYRFVTIDSRTVPVSNNTAMFSDVYIKQGTPVTVNYTVQDSVENPNFVIRIPDDGIDTTTIKVTIRTSSSNSSSEVFTEAKNYLELSGASKVFFLEEGTDQKYRITFGDGILGKKLFNGNVVVIQYIVTKGVAGAGANSFVLMNSVNGYSNNVVYPINSATTGGSKETIDSIKFQAPKSYAAQGRAVTTEDYITAIQQNKLGFSFDAVNVWGGEENIPPVYGQVFVSMKPTGSLILTDIQKSQIVKELIRPISMITVSPTIVDPDYTFLKITANVVINSKKTTLSFNQIKDKIATAIQSFSTKTLNTFNSIFSLADLIVTIQNSDPSIVSNEVNVAIQKKFIPTLNNSQTYKLYCGTPLQKGVYLSGITSSPSMQFFDLVSGTTIVPGVYIQELPSIVAGVESITISNPGFGYQYPPLINIVGDGIGATAQAIINSVGSITAINILNPGTNYSSAVAIITPVANDTTGKLGAVTVNLSGAIGKLQSYYFNQDKAKTILNPNLGTVDYTNGLITLNDFNPIQIDNPLGQLTITATPKSSIISSSYNRVITIDPYDPGAITVNLTVQQ
jgi:hypothetical protein